MLELRSGRTNREYLQALRDDQRHTVRQPLGDLTDAFDRAWYGHLPFGEEEYRACEALAREVVSRASQGRAA
jgi:hypothetical protein